MIENNKGAKQFAQTCILIALTAVFIFPILLVFMNSFKSRLYVSTDPFALPSGAMFVGFENYIRGITSSGFFIAFIRSVWITVVGVLLIIICTSMTAWYIVRVKGKFTRGLYYAFTFSMIVPFQMVMYTMTFVVNRISFDNVFGILFVSVFGISYCAWRCLIINDMLAVFHIQIRVLLEAYHFVVMHAISVIAGPVGIIRDLGVGNPAAGIFGDPECLVKAVDAHGSLSAALGMRFIRAEPVFANIAGGGEDLFPASVLVPFMHGDGRGRQICAHAGHNKELFHVLILCLGELCDPFGRICFLLDVSMETGIF